MQHQNVNQVWNHMIRNQAWSCGFRLDQILTIYNINALIVQFTNLIYYWVFIFAGYSVPPPQKKKVLLKGLWCVDVSFCKPKGGFNITKELFQLCVFVVWLLCCLEGEPHFPKRVEEPSDLCLWGAAECFCPSERTFPPNCSGSTNTSRQKTDVDFCLFVPLYKGQFCEANLPWRWIDGSF